MLDNIPSRHLLYPLGLVLTTTSYKILNLIYSKQKTPYIDEIFHVPQAQRYCQGDWLEWDPKITTLPGLYLVSYALLKPFGFYGYENYCSVFALRITNLVGTILNYYLAYRICSSLEEKYQMKSERYCKLLTALNVAIFPPLYFFSFLYYTDVWSTTFVFLMYHNHLLKGTLPKIMATFASMMAVLMRQTNVVWVVFMIIDAAWEIISGGVKNYKVQDLRYTLNVLRCLQNEILFGKKGIRRLKTLVSDIFFRTWHYVTVCLLFTGFVFLNGGVVVGDKAAHNATFHPMQNLYFLDFTAFFALPFYGAEASSILKSPPNYVMISSLIAFCSAVNKINRLEHPYLLADNRHLTFYLWKRVFGHKVFRYLIVPIYVYSGVILVRILRKRCNFVVMAAIALCAIVNLTPQYLFELRYFIVPFLMFRLQFKATGAVYLETLFFFAINYAVINLFANRPFVWPSEPDVVQRFIW